METTTTLPLTEEALQPPKLTIREFLSGFQYNNPENEGENTEALIYRTRFRNERRCPYCQNKHIIRNGHIKQTNTQKYICRGCGKNFTLATNTILSRTQKDANTWKKYIECMINGYTLKKSAEICRINITTAFFWRHKILEVIRSQQDSSNIGGVIELGDTYFKLSFKGNPKGKKASKIKKAKVCISCAANRNFKAISKISNLGKVKAKFLHRVFDEKIKVSSTLISKKSNTYTFFAKKNKNDMVKIRRMKPQQNFFNLQNILIYQIGIKEFIRNFCGVATKYLNNYLAWFNFMMFPLTDFGELKQLILSKITAFNSTITYNKISNRSTIPAL